MPEFILREPSRHHPFYDLNEFERGYVEAMFFTNCDCGSEDEDLANRLGVGRMTRASVAAIKRDCETFRKYAGAAIDMACAANGYDEARAGNDLWFTRQGHGVGYWDRRRELSAHVRDALTDAAERLGEVYVDIYGGWIRHP